jgi:hydrogenase maturation protease
MQQEKEIVDEYSVELSGSPRTAIMGFGNPCRSDDAAGLYVIETLKKKIEDRNDISLFDMGTGAFEVLFKLKGHQRIIIVDAVVNTDEQDGTLYKLPASEIEAGIQNDPMVFLHSLKWDQALSYAKKILQDEYPADISVYLIAVSDTKLEIRLSDTVRMAAEKAATMILEELKSVPNEF